MSKDSGIIPNAGGIGMPNTGGIPNMINNQPNPQVRPDGMGQIGMGMGGLPKIEL